MRHYALIDIGPSWIMQMQGWMMSLTELVMSSLHVQESSFLLLALKLQAIKNVNIHSNAP